MTFLGRTLMQKHSIVIYGAKTSICLERAFWDEFKRIARQRDMLLGQLAAIVDARRDPKKNNLSSAVRVFVLQNVRRRARVNQIKARTATKRVGNLEVSLKDLMRASKQFSDGLAPIAAVIAGSRTNA